MSLQFLTWAGSLALAATAALSEPKISKDEGNFHLDIGRAVHAALKKHDPYFEIWQEMDFIPAVRQVYKAGPNQTLSGIVGDFNNDHIKDVVVIGRNRTHNLMLAAVSNGSNYQVIEVQRAPLTDPHKSWIEGPKGKETGLWIYLEYRKPGLLSSPFEKNPVQLKAEAFSEIYFEKGAVVHYLKDGKFEQFTTSD